jgi:hypothetical protein
MWLTSYGWYWLHILTIACLHHTMQQDLYFPTLNAIWKLSES